MTQIKLFAHLADILGPEIELELPIRADRSTILKLVAESYPLQADLIKLCNVAVNHEYIYDEPSDLTDAEIALIPPVSGG
ncbi:MAG: MoaD/ThiS family protein [Streptococcaceae bacterium]|jgi:molybdopterin converting factor small subunit|nr:MoaD/ThiS family protein [Streptococcaceae bacterium]